MASNIETLKKLVYNNIDQLLQDLNRNFAVLENSPLYKGIPGKGGDGGDPGLRGVRGTQFLFVDLIKFQTQFPGELTAGSGITLAYINTKIKTFENKQKLFKCFDITELVDHDIIVLTNSVMLSYDFIDDIFIDTGIAFNEQSNILNNIEKKIEDYVKYYVDNISPISKLKNIFLDYASYAKNYADTNNVFVTTAITGSSIYSPYIPGYNNQIGIPLLDHKYFGYSDIEFPKENNGTIVFGSIKKYYELLMSTIITDGKDSLSSDYAPGVGNIPSAIFMQDTYNNGLLFGYKNKTNLKRFGSIFKNEIDELIIKSDSSKIDSEFSSIKLHKDYLKYDKQVIFGNNLEVSRDTSLFGDIKNKSIATGKFTVGATEANNFNSGVTELGTSQLNSVTINVSDYEEYKKYLDVVFVSDGTGRVLKSYKIEKGLLNEADIIDLNPISTTLNSKTNIPTSYYFDFLARKVNAVTQYAKDNYWRKNQFGTGDIPSLNLSADLTVQNNSNISSIITTNKLAKTLNITSDNFTDNSINKTLTSFRNNVLVTDGLGNILKTFSLDKQVLDNAELPFGVSLNVYSNSAQTLISTYHYGFLAQKINNITTSVTGNYWKKDQYNTYDIPALALSQSLKVRGTVMFNPDQTENVFEVRTDKQVIIGGDTNLVTLKSSQITFSKFLGKVLVTDAGGVLTNTYNIESNNFIDANLPADILIQQQVSSTTSIPRGSHLGWLTTKINNIIGWIKSAYWTRTQLSDGSVNSLRTANLTVDTNLTVGDPNNPNITANPSLTNIGKSGGVLNILASSVTMQGKNNAVLVGDSNGTIRADISLETSYPTNMDVGSIRSNHWQNTSQSFGTIATSFTRLLSSNFFNWVYMNLVVVREMLFDRPTFSQLNSLLPQGSIIIWTNTFGGVPAGFTICDGRQVGTTGVFTPNMTDKFIKGSLTPNTAGGNAGNNILVNTNQLPSHTHNVQINAAGEHKHNIFGDGLHTHSYSRKTNWLKGSTGGNSGYLQNEGDNTYTTASDGWHNHQMDFSGTHVHTGTATATGGNAPINIEPDSFTVIFIMKN